MKFAWLNLLKPETSPLAVAVKLKCPEPSSKRIGTWAPALERKTIGLVGVGSIGAHLAATVGLLVVALAHRTRVLRLCAILPWHGGLWRAARDEIARAAVPGQRSVLAHRDLHDGQFLVDGGTIALLDFDLLARAGLIIRMHFDLRLFFVGVFVTIDANFSQVA